MKRCYSAKSIFIQHCPSVILTDTSSVILMFCPCVSTHHVGTSPLVRSEHIQLYRTLKKYKYAEGVGTFMASTFILFELQPDNRNWIYTYDVFSFRTFSIPVC